MAQHGDREGCHRQLPLVQLAAYPEYDWKRDHHRYRQGDAGASGPEQNEFPDCHGKERSARWGSGAVRQKERLCIAGSVRVGNAKPSTATAG